ncbi:acyl-CoA synthetase [Nitriliruptor alkaliphilus]|uniref:acyl-CoA synthetase n=1 Tax=Nitriliruptor alkaliphilus TaxID=427918 RepID=UPI0009FAF4CA|nr:AMP-binding protein [Nitriliruptor alkaliphilus]
MTDYEAERAAFHLEVPAAFNATRDIVDARAASDPDRAALLMVSPDGRTADRYTFAQLRDRTCQAANVLADLGVTKGDRILVMLPRVIAWYDVVLAAIRLGAIPMPATTQLTAKDLAYRIDRAEASVVVTDPDGMARIDAIRADRPSLRLALVADGAADDWVDLSAAMADASITEPDVVETAADDPMLIYFTSGTTGNPKMVLHTHASYGLGHQITARYWQDLGPGDIFWGVSDTGWAKAAWSKLFGQWGVGATVMAWNAQGKPDFEQMLRMIVDHGVTVFCAPPTIYRNFVLRDLSGYDFSSLRHCLAAGEALNPETFEAWRRATGTAIHDGYGQTETVNLLANYPCMPIKPGSLGKPTPGLDVVIVDEQGEPLPPGSEGQIAVRVQPQRPPWLFTEYWRDEEATARSHLGDYYLTGDRAHVDEDGYFWFRSRNDDVIISSGYRIGPFEVESVLMEHEAVAETAVIGVPDEMRGEAVKAFVVLAPGHEPSSELAAELQQFVKEQTAPYKYPREVTFMEELPKTISGKIRRVELRRLPA